MTRNEHLFTPYKHSILTGKTHWAFIASAALTLIVCVAADSASAANARSNAGLVTNNQTYTGFGDVLNTGDYSSAARSDVHNRPLSIDARANATRETVVTPGQTVITPGTATYVAPNTAYVTPPTAYTTPPTATTVIVPDHPRVSTETNGRVTTRVYEKPANVTAYPGAVGDVNARTDAGVIITNPVTSTTPVVSPATGGVEVKTYVNP